VNEMLRLVKLRFTSPLHIGQAGLGLEESSFVIHSDTLYSCIFHTWFCLFNEPMPFISLSSAFPYVGETLYFPKPFLPLPGFNNELALKYGKSFKKMRFVAYEHFVRWIKGISLDFDKMLDDNSELERIMRFSIRPQVALDRLTASSKLYFVGETYFDIRQNAGLFFIVDLADVNWEKLKQVIIFMGEEGIGGRKSSGYGHFEPTFVNGFIIDEIDKPDAYLTLSLVCPASDDEVRENLIAYQLIERTGWLESKQKNYGIRHQRLMMLEEGSIFKKAPLGKIVDVAPPGFDAHPVYRYGKAFNVGVKLGAIK